jgi:Rod binding domain-containing protein
MMNLLNGINGQMPVKAKQAAPRAELTAKKQQSAGEGNDNADIRQAAKEMESLFAFQMLKVMRETSESMAGEKKGNGYNTYMSMFDTEISKVLAERGMGLQDSIVRWLGRNHGVNEVYNKDSNNINETDKKD